MTLLGMNHELLELLIDGWSPWTWQFWQWQPAALKKISGQTSRLDLNLRFKKGSDLQCWLADVMIFYRRSGQIRNRNLWFCLGDFVGSLVLLIYSICHCDSVTLSKNEDWTSSERSFISANLGPDSPMGGFQVHISPTSTPPPKVKCNIEFDSVNNPCQPSSVKNPWWRCSICCCSL